MIYILPVIYLDSGERTDMPNYTVQYQRIEILQALVNAASKEEALEKAKYDVIVQNIETVDVDYDYYEVVDES